MFSEQSRFTHIPLPFYSETDEQSSEYLRLILPLLHEYRISPNPVNYAVLYEYVAGRNAKLAESLENNLQVDAEYNGKKCRQLYEQYISRCNDEETEKRGARLHQLLEQTMGYVSNNSSKATDAGDSLREYMLRLGGDLNEEDLQALLSEIIRETGAVADLSMRLSEHLVATTLQVEHLREELEEARQAATTDMMTGVLNKTAFHRRFSMLLEKDAKPAMMVIDIDNFKTVNDRYGHLLGDKVIQFVATTLRYNFKGRDVVGRFGGDEFAVLLPRTALNSAHKLAGKVCTEIQKTELKRTDTGVPIDTISVSIGVSAYQPGDTQEKLFQRADTAMYRSKQAGGNRVSLQS